MNELTAEEIRQMSNTPDLGRLITEEWKRRIAAPFAAEIERNARIWFKRQRHPYTWDEISLLAKQSYYASAAERFFSHG